MLQIHSKKSNGSDKGKGPTKSLGADKEAKKTIHPKTSILRKQEESGSETMQSDSSV